jgi:pyrroloquinoline quinone (PQQ) biosynthesis protein C
LVADAEYEAAELVARNLADELGHPEPHLQLFDSFAAALPAAPVAAAPGASATALADTYRDLARQSPVAALAGLAAYETQAAAIASSKGEGLRRWYGMDAAGTRFWDVHSSMDMEHGDWAVEALALLGADADEVAAGARRAADAWWALLDEREEEGQAA